MSRSSRDEIVPGIVPGTRGRSHFRSRRNTRSSRPAGRPGPQEVPADRRLRARPSLPTRTQRSREIPPFGNSTSAQGRRPQWPATSSHGLSAGPRLPFVTQFVRFQQMRFSSGKPDLLKPVPLFRQPIPDPLTGLPKDLNMPELPLLPDLFAEFDGWTEGARASGRAGSVMTPVQDRQGQTEALNSPVRPRTSDAKRKTPGSGGIRGSRIELAYSFGKM